MSIPFAVHIPFVEQIGCTLEHFADDRAEIALTLDPARHANSFGVAHGGLLMTLLDVAMAHAARCRHKDLPDGGPGLVTLELKTSFMRPGTGRLRAIGTVLQGTAKMAFTEGRVLNDKGELCAHATATFKFLRALPVGPGEVRASAYQRLSGAGSD